eukprot:6196889-Pleurochrysis_carterae.AAC.5
MRAKCTREDLAAPAGERMRALDGTQDASRGKERYKTVCQVIGKSAFKRECRRFQASLCALVVTSIRRPLELVKD